jgi:UDP:flavonoid glycosyltransferase YjiC (YdhE family)
VPDNVIRRSWVDQAALLPDADVVVHHGGSGTTLGALAVGVPQLILPQGADQYANAEAVTAAGAAVTLLPGDLTADAIAARTRELQADGAYREAARSIADEIARMPSPAEVARLPEFV